MGVRLSQAVLDATLVLTAFGGTCPESTLPEVQALKSRPPLNARQAGKRGSYLPDFWKGIGLACGYAYPQMRTIAHGFTAVIRNLRVCL